MEFEWDEDKRRANIAKHDVDFVEIASLLEGWTFRRIDDRRDYGEVRLVSTGVHQGVVYTLIHTQRNSVTRLISAWKAGRNERERYQAGYVRRNRRDEEKG